MLGISPKGSCSLLPAFSRREVAGEAGLSRLSYLCQTLDGAFVQLQRPKVEGVVGTGSFADILTVLWEYSILLLWARCQIPLRLG